MSIKSYILNARTIGFQTRQRGEEFFQVWKRNVENRFGYSRLTDDQLNTIFQQLHDEDGYASMPTEWFIKELDDEEQTIEKDCE